MKHIIYILPLIVLASCGRSNSEQNPATISDKISIDDTARVHINSTEDEQSLEYYRKQSLSSYKKATLFNLSDTLTADFNGDGILDKAFYKKERQASGIIIKHGKSNEEFKIGFGKPFAHMTEFDWVDYWGLVEDKETTETTFTEDGDVLGGQIVKLQYPSIVLGKDEVGGGLITFRNGQYAWIHQTC